MAGLAAAGVLHEHGHEVTVLDKGRSPGGRLATRRLGAARCDHGAQFFTVRSERFAVLVDGWRRQGVVREWCRGFDAAPDGYPRYAVAGGMNALAKHLARGLDVRCTTLVFAVRPGDRGWSVGLDDGTAVPADALIVTCPLPQAFAVLVQSGVSLPEPLRTTEYDRTLTLMVALDGPSAVPAPGGVQGGDPLFSFIGDNRAKGTSDTPAVTFHANAAWSEAHWDTDREEVRTMLLQAARPWIGNARVVADSTKRWRFATPRTLWPEPCWVGDGHAPVVIAGDAFAGPRRSGSNLEGAALSGLAAAEALLT
jgi:hypothetical protein